MRIPVFWHIGETPATMSSKPLLLRELNPHLICTICCGYLIDATTITECLHSFCKSCIVKHLEKSNFCPACDVQVHKAKPLMHIRPDRTLQDLVYKLVPELFRSEMARRKEFLSKHPEAGAFPEGSISSRMLFFAPNDQISLSLEYIEPSCRTGEFDDVTEEKSAKDVDLTDSGKKVLGKRYLCCPAAVTVGHLQKFIRLKYDLEYRYKVDILCHSELLLPEYRLLDVAYITSWTQEEPLRLFYRIYQIKHHYDRIRADSPKGSVSIDNVNCRKNDQVITSRGECAKIGSDAPPIEQTLPSNVTNLEEARGVKRQLPATPKAKSKPGVVAKKPRLEEISQSARLKLIAKAKSEKVNGHDVAMQQVKVNENGAVQPAELVATAQVAKLKDNTAVLPVKPKDTVAMQSIKSKDTVAVQPSKPKENIAVQPSKPKENVAVQPNKPQESVSSSGKSVAFKQTEKKSASVSSRGESSGFRPIADSREPVKSGSRSGPLVLVAKPTPKPGSEIAKPRSDTVKIPKPESTKKANFKGESDLRPLRPDALPLPPIGRIDPKSPTKSPTKYTAKPEHYKQPATPTRNEFHVPDKPKSSNGELNSKSHDKIPEFMPRCDTSVKKAVTIGSAEQQSALKSLVSAQSKNIEQQKPINEAGKVLSGKMSPTEKPLPELREIDKRSFLEQVDLTEKKETDLKAETVSETLLSEIRDRALSKKSHIKDLTVRAPSISPPESIADIKEFISATSPENKLKQENNSSGGEIKSDEDPPSKRRKSTNGGTIRTMPNLIAISEIPTPLIARSMQTMAGSKKPEVKIMEAVKNGEVRTVTKEGNSSPLTSAIILDLSGKSSRSTSRSSSVGTPDDRKSPSPPIKRTSPPAVSITERIMPPKPSPSAPVAPPAKCSPQPQNSPLPHLGGASMFQFPNMSMQSQANLSRSASVLSQQNQMLQHMALAQRQQQIQHFQAAMYAASAAKQAVNNTTSPLTNRAEFERVRNMLTYNALAQWQNQRPPAPAVQESPRPSTSKTPDKPPSSMMMKLPNVTRPKVPITKPGHDPMNVRIKHFIQSQQSARAASGQGPRASNSSVREIPNPSLLQQRRLTQLLHAGASQDRVTITKAETQQPSPKEIVETKLAANKEITVSIVNPEDKVRKSPDSKKE